MKARMSRTSRMLNAMVLSSCCLLGLAANAGAQITYHGGPVILSAKVVNIFWGPTFAPGGVDNAYANTLSLYRNQLGTTREYKIITQYYQIVGTTQQFIQLSNLGTGTADWFDTSTPPANVTDTIARNEIRAYLATHAFDPSTIYELYLPASSYSSNGSLTSCGGPGLAYCTYHNFIASGSNRIKYTVQPYQSCGGCQVAGFTAAQNQEVFVAYSTRGAASNPLFNAWYDNVSGIEMGDKCLWSPPPFLDGGAYPYDWSNLVNACVKW